MKKQKKKQQPKNNSSTSAESKSQRFLAVVCRRRLWGARCSREFVSFFLLLGGVWARVLRRPHHNIVASTPLCILMKSFRARWIGRAPDVGVEDR